MYALRELLCVVITVVGTWWGRRKSFLPVLSLFVNWFCKHWIACKRSYIYTPAYIINAIIAFVCCKTKKADYECRMWSILVFKAISTTFKIFHIYYYVKPLHHYLTFKTKIGLTDENVGWISMTAISFLIFIFKITQMLFTTMYK